MINAVQSTHEVMLSVYSLVRDAAKETQRRSLISSMLIDQAHDAFVPLYTFSDVA